MSEQKAGLTRAQTLLVTSHMTNVAKIAQQMSRNIESEFSVDELRACGYFGLLKAARGFAPEQGAFMAYATPLVRGAIVDGVRRLSHMSRRQRQGYFAEAQKDWASFEQLRVAVVPAELMSASSTVIPVWLISAREDWRSHLFLCKMLYVVHEFHWLVERGME